MSAHLCECGCGTPTPLATQTVRSRGQIGGQPTRYIAGHYAGGKRTLKGAENQNWRGGVMDSGRYLTRQVPGHPRANRVYVYEHVLVAEAALGRYLPTRVEVHHVDGNTKNNAPSNLVVCENHAYHMLLHQRQRAMDACGNPDARRCWICGNYDLPENVRIDGHSGALHRACATKMRREHHLSRETRARVPELKYGPGGGP